MITVDRNIFTSLLAMPDRIFVRQEALRVGVRDEALIAGVRRGSIARLCRGAYTAPGPWTTEQHRRLLARAGLRLYPDAALMGGTAVAAHGIPLFEVPSAPADLARPIAREAKAKGLRFRPLRHAIVTTQWGPATDLATSLVQLTMDHGVLPGVASIDAALHSRAVGRDALGSAFDRVEGWPGSHRARCALAWCDPRAESLGESVTRAILLAAGYHVESQVPIADRDGVVFARVDLGIEGTHVLIEFDGKVKYTEDGPDALFREKKREDRIRSHGYVVIRVTWADLFHPERIIQAVRDALAQAA
jgi:very-short-patch-repair endonuclease